MNVKVLSLVNTKKLKPRIIDQKKNRDYNKPSLFT